MNLEETEDTARFILDIRQELGIAILLVEHDMGLVMDIADRVLVLDFGVKIAEGTGRGAARSAVVAAYLGDEERLGGAPGFAAAWRWPSSRQPSSRTPAFLALDRTHREAGDEAIEEHREHHRDRYGDEHGGRFQRLPEEHVAAHQFGGHAGAHPFCELGEMKARA